MKFDLSDIVIPFTGHPGNAYLLPISSGYLAVDPGTPAVARKMADFVMARGESPQRIGLATSTHVHINHVGGLRELQRLTSCEIYLHRQARRLGIVNEARSLAFRLLKPFRRDCWRPLESHTRSGKANRSARDYVWPFKVHGWLEHEATLPGGWRVIYTPGHTPDSVCLYHLKRKVLLAGDTLVGLRSGSLIVNPFNADDEVLAMSLLTLGRLRVEVVYPGHGRPAHGEVAYQRALNRQPRAYFQRGFRRLLPV